MIWLHFKYILVKSWYINLFCNQ